MRTTPMLSCLSIVLVAVALPVTACGGGANGGQASNAPASNAAAATSQAAGAAKAVNAPPGVAAWTVTLKPGNPCSMLHPVEVEQIIGVPVAGREIADESTCNFPFAAPPKAPAGAKPGDASPEAMAKAMAAPMAGGPGQLSIKVYWDKGPTAIMATRMASKLLGSDSGFERLEGIGDEAWLGPMASTLVFAKGKMAIEIDLRMVPDAREKGIRLAKLIASRLP
jgi:hypothetical protein